MTQNRVDRIKGVVMFVLAWLIGLYVYEVVQEYFHGTIGFAAAALTLGVNIYARRRAAACVEANWTFKFWLYLPVILFFTVPIAAKLVIFLTSEGDQSWWAHLFSLLPFILKLGVPVAALLWAYWALGRLPTNEGEAVKTAG